MEVTRKPSDIGINVNNILSSLHWVCKIMWRSKADGPVFGVACWIGSGSGPERNNASNTMSDCAFPYKYSNYIEAPNP